VSRRVRGDDAVAGRCEGRRRLGLGKETGGGRRVLRRFGAEGKSEKEEPPVRGKRHSVRVFSQSASGDRSENSWIGDRRKLGLHFSPFNVILFYLLFIAPL